MKLGEIVRFEIAYQLRRPWTWLTAVAVAAFVRLFVRTNYIADAIYVEGVLNTPLLLTGAMVFGGLIWLIMGAAVAGEAGARDAATGMHPLVYTSSVRKSEYLGGRFLAALAVNALVLLAAPVGVALGYHGLGVPPDAVGPFRAAAYLSAFGVVLLPNAVFATALQFALAVRSGRPMAAYAGSVLLVFMGFFIASAVLFGRDLGSLLDPIGIRYVVEDLAHEWTRAEQETRLVLPEGLVLANRLLWLATGLATLGIVALRFRFAHRAERSRWRSKKRSVQTAPTPGRIGIGVTAGPAVVVPYAPRASGAAVWVRQALATSWTSFRTLATSGVGLALLVAVPLLSVPVIADQVAGGLMALVPTTGRVLGELTSPLTAERGPWVIVPLLIVFFAGELVWRERDAGLGDLMGALPRSDGAALAGSFLGLGLVLALFMGLLMGAGLLAQTLLGYSDPDVGLYLTVLFGLQLPEYLLFALLALVVHVAVDQKYVGHIVALLAYVAIVLSPMVGVEHDLLVYGASPGWTYTEMGGFGASLGPWLWFKAYWAAWALLLTVGARLLWVRGRSGGLRSRLRVARDRLAGATRWAAAVAAGLVLVLGGFVFANTNVRNDYRTSSDRAEAAAAYEQRYGHYADATQPEPAATRLRVEIYPERQALEIEGTYRLVNRSGIPIDSILVTATLGVETDGVAFDRPARCALDERLGVRACSLARPLAPGDSLAMAFKVRAEPDGFTERGVASPVVANGTYFTAALLPAVGYDAGRELTAASDRRDYGLPPRPLIRSLTDEEARADRVTSPVLDVVMGTDADQIAVAPGALVRTWTEEGRRYAHYRTSKPVGSPHFVSARYDVRRAQWEDPASGQTVDVRIYHDPRHTAHLDRVVAGIRASLDVFTREFGPYRYTHLTLVERPGDGDGGGVHASSSMLIYEEGFSLIRPPEDPDAFDQPYAVIAHEMAHQWTVPYANVEGAPVLSESLAWYYAMRTVEEARGADGLQALLDYLRGSRRPIRLGAPLLRGVDPYMSYRKGPFALYALSEYVGTEPVHRALRRLVDGHRPEDAPLATTLDLYRQLDAETPDSLRYLLHDLFEVNTTWDLATERATAIEADGTWRVTLDVRARKTVTDSAGVETEAPMDEWVRVSVFAEPGSEGDVMDRPLYDEWHRIRPGQQTITLAVPSRPARAGIDSYQLLDWESGGGDDNVRAVDVDSRER